MKSNIVFFICCPLFFLLDFRPLNSQQVGIGTTNPSELLDVNGNININGQFKINGNAGSSGQVLAKNGSNNLSWINMNLYPNISSFDCLNDAVTPNSNNCSYEWVVPSNITSVIVEAWGGGGGGGRQSGGGGGAYISSRLTVTPGSTIQILVGASGNNGSIVTDAIKGGSSTVIYNSISLTAEGGLGGYVDLSSLPYFGRAGGSFFASGISNNEFLGYAGEYSKSTMVAYQQVSSNDFAKVYYFGNGGDAGATENSGGQGGYQIVSSGGATLSSKWAEIRAACPGAGGGADFDGGRKGRGGRVIIHW